MIWIKNQKYSIKYWWKIWILAIKKKLITDCDFSTTVKITLNFTHFISYLFDIRDCVIDITSIQVYNTWKFGPWRLKGAITLCHINLLKLTSWSVVWYYSCESVCFFVLNLSGRELDFWGDHRKMNKTRNPVR